jgi:hypothetical protein
MLFSACEACRKELIDVLPEEVLLMLLVRRREIVESEIQRQMPLWILWYFYLVRNASDVRRYTTECHYIFRAVATVHKYSLHLNLFLFLSFLNH